MAAAALEAVAALASEVTHNSIINKKIIQTTWQGKGKPGSHGVGLAWRDGHMLGSSAKAACWETRGCQGA